MDFNQLKKTPLARLCAKLIAIASYERGALRANYTVTSKDGLFWLQINITDQDQPYTASLMTNTNDGSISLGMSEINHGHPMSQSFNGSDAILALVEEDTTVYQRHWDAFKFAYERGTVGEDLPQVSREHSFLWEFKAPKVSISEE